MFRVLEIKKNKATENEMNTGPYGVWYCTAPRDDYFLLVKIDMVLESLMRFQVYA